MNVENSLAGVAIAVEHGPIPAILKPSFACDESSLSNHLADQRIVCRRDVVDGRDVPSRDDERMKWSLGIDVLNHDQGIVFVKDLGWYLVRNDLAEKTVGHDTSVRGDELIA